MRQYTRFAKHFAFIGNFDHHYGILEGYGSTLPFNEGPENAVSTMKESACC
ncbi:MAG: hypothetical protein KUG76_01155 [Gammaproteobacteria bacterium]|nr:hypothetical protein [Gammaproteobacteria bacterium]